MNDSHNEDEDTEWQGQDEQHQELNADRMLEARISHALQKQAARIQFTGELRSHIMQNLPSRHTTNHRRFLAPALTLAALLLIVFSFATYLLLNQHPPLQYRLSQIISVPAELAHGGQLLSLDPTEHHLVYQPAYQPGVMYTVDIRNPLTSNVLAMRYAHNVGWSPDGTELVTTVVPAGATSPLLALVRVGEYMKLLGPGAEAASWSPTSAQQILYITQSHSRTQLWTTTSSGQSSQEVATMNVSLPIQQIVWSHDGQKLALLTTANNATQQAGSALYLMDAHIHALKTIVKAGPSTINMVDWSPDNHYLAYEQVDTQRHTTLDIVDVDQQKELFTLTIQKKLAGLSWSPASNAIVYSDGGTLHTYTLYGVAIQLPRINATQYYPFWLKDGRILYMNIVHGEGKLAMLTKSVK